jgi:hypothetical protein
MVAPDRPTPLADTPQYILDRLGRQDAESLRQIAAHAEELADWKEAQAAAEMDDEDVVLGEELHSMVNIAHGLFHSGGVEALAWPSTSGQVGTWDAPAGRVSL